MARSPIKPHPKGENMKALTFSKYGNDPKQVLSVAEIPKPFIAKPKDVLIKVSSAALNPIDKIRLNGTLKLLSPERTDVSVLGYDASGVVEEVGSEVSKFKPGDRVYTRIKRMNPGAIAEFLVDDESMFAAMPSNLSFTEAASVPLAGETAYQVMKQANLTADSRVFITGGAGGVGTLAIQIAKKMFGVQHVATTASAGVGAELCTSVGADLVVNYREDKFWETLKKDYDFAFDTTGETEQLCHILKEGGKVVTIAGNPTVESISRSLGGKSPPFLLKMFLWFGRNRKADKSAKTNGVTWEHYFLQPTGADLEAMNPYFESGDMKAVVDTETDSLDDYLKAVEKSWSGRAKGKCVITVNKETESQAN